MAYDAVDPVNAVLDWVYFLIAKDSDLVTIGTRLEIHALHRLDAVASGKPEVVKADRKRRPMPADVRQTSGGALKAHEVREFFANLRDGTWTFRLDPELASFMATETEATPYDKKLWKVLRVSKPESVKAEAKPLSFGLTRRLEPHG